MSESKDPLVSEAKAPAWVFLLVVIGALATCAITNATEDATLAECYRAGWTPAECKP
jgi:hypothetical protein